MLAVHYLKLIDEMKKKVINDGFPKEEIHNVDHSELVAMAYCHTPFVLVSIRKDKEYDLLNFIEKYHLKYIKICSMWKDTRDEDYKNKEANMDTLYLIVFDYYVSQSKEFIQEKILPKAIEMLSLGLVDKTFELIYRPIEADTARKFSRLSLLWDIYGARYSAEETSPEKQVSVDILYSDEFEGFYRRHGFHYMLNRFLSVSHGTYKRVPAEYCGWEHHHNIEATHYLYVKDIKPEYQYTKCNMISLLNKSWCQDMIETYTPH